MGDDINGIVVVRFDERGEIDYQVIGDVRLFIIDERCSDDRVYEWTCRNTPDQIQEVLGSSEIGHSGDGKLSDNQVQAIRAKLFQADGKALSVLNADD
jgi:hypothetical protein